MSDALGAENSSSGSLTELEILLGHRFKDRSLLLRALTHRSYANEHENADSGNNEPLEFLGDAVLGFLVSSEIFRRFPGLNEGELSKIKAYLVSAANLVHLAERLRLGEYLRLGRGEEKTGGRSKKAILADACEAALGAIYLDGGVRAASAFVNRHLGGWFETVKIERLLCGDPKSALQEQLHDMGKAEPSYEVVDEIGPDHQKVFVVQLLLDDEVIAQASGKTKKEAQQEAARLALETLRGD